MSIHDKPTWNLFTTDGCEYNLEHELFDSVVNEFTEIGGFPIYYWIKTNVENADFLYGEDQTEQFDGPYESKVVYQPTEETEILNSFGLSSSDTLQYVEIPKSKFKEDIAEKYGEPDNIPKPGDVIQLWWNGKLYNVVDVGAEQKIFQAKKMIWELICRPYTYSEESSSAEDVLYSEPPSAFFDEDNNITETQPLSAYGENDNIEDESYDNPDSAIYGYD